jgi:hypothetical protein
MSREKLGAIAFGLCLGLPAALCAWYVAKLWFDLDSELIGSLFAIVGAAIVLGSIQLTRDF